MAMTKAVKARQIFDSHGNPTVEVDVTLSDGTLVRAAVPRSASTGMAIFDTMKHIRPDVSTVCVGLAASVCCWHEREKIQPSKFEDNDTSTSCGAQGGQTDLDIQSVAIRICSRVC